MAGSNTLDGRDLVFEDPEDLCPGLDLVRPVALDQRQKWKVNQKVAGVPGGENLYVRQKKKKVNSVPP